MRPVSSYRIERLADGDDLDDAFAVRRTVFVEEQGVSEDIEYDGLDEEAIHFLAYDEGEPVGTTRLRPLDASTGKVERVAVRQEWRGEGWGRRLMEAAERTARDRDLDTLVLHAQQSVEEFYRDCGYETTSSVFEEAGIPHVEMEKGI